MSKNKTKVKREMRAAANAEEAALRRVSAVPRKKQTRFRDLDFDERVRRVEKGAGLGLEIAKGLRSLIPFETSNVQATGQAFPVVNTPGMQVTAPSAAGYVTTTGRPVGMTKINVRHRELLGTIGPVTGSPGDFQLIYNQPINPGNPNMFPWLSQIACRYQHFRFRKLKFIYEPSVGTNIRGNLYQSIDYNVQDVEPIDAIQFMSFEGATKSPPWWPNCMEATADGLNQSKSYYTFMGVGGLPPNSDPKSYFPGRYLVAEAGLVDTDTMGELYVEYDVALYTPQLSASCLQASISGGISDTALFTDPPLGIEPVVLGNVGLQIVAQTQASFGNGAQIYLSVDAVGEYLFGFIYLTNSSTSSWRWNISSNTAITALMGLDDATLTFSGNGTNVSNSMTLFKLSVLGPGAQFNMQAVGANFDEIVGVVFMAQWDFGLDPMPTINTPEALLDSMSVSEYLRHKNRVGQVLYNRSQKYYGAAARRNLKIPKAVKEFEPDQKPRSAAVPIPSPGKAKPTPTHRGVV